ncbi:MAG: hypothetical protein OEW08_13360, partial [Gammaproteobacteria bacterium]|nr:hypothetical protein [Gammaproteobacteria bacterium]
MKIQFVNLAGLAFLVVVCGCGGGSSSSESTAQIPTVGKNSVATAVRDSAPPSACLNGGISVDAGIDTNANGVLDTAEVTSTQYVCNGVDGVNGVNGANGANGLNALVSVTLEATGANCTNGGYKVSVGNDANGNQILDSSEVTSSHYICNGINGTNGVDGTNGVNGTNGTNGTNGINGANGANGLNSLLAIVTEPVGGNCRNGGKKITAGLDSNSNGILDSTEITTTQYICNGPGINWQYVTGPIVQTVSNTGYLVDNSTQVAVVLPAAPAVGDVVQVTGV